MEGYFFDILGEWAKFVPYLNAERFIESLNIYHWWNFRGKEGNTLPLIKTSDDMSEDESYVVDQLSSSNVESPYWYCVPHECVELNSLVMGTLASLYTKREMNELYSLAINPENLCAYHVVISNKILSAGDMIHLARNKNNLITASHEDVVDNDKLILFDLIYPMMPFFGKSWVYRYKNLRNLTVLGCDTLEKNWDDMGYTGYYKS